MLEPRRAAIALSEALLSSIALFAALGVVASATARHASAQTVPAASACIRYAPRGLPKRRVGAGVRGPGAIAITLVAPKDHLPETAAASPSLYWELPAHGGASIDRVTFSLTELDPDSAARPRQVSLAAPHDTGLQRVRLDLLHIVLTPAVEYLWRIQVDLSNGMTGQDAALIRRRPASSPAHGDALYRARVASADRRWYDAFAALADSAAISHARTIVAARDSYRANARGGASCPR